MEKKLQNLIAELENWGAEPQQVLDDTFLSDYDFYESCLVNFSNTVNLQSLKDILVPDKMEQAIRMVHTWKGNSDYLGLFPVTDATISILSDLRNQNMDQVDSDIKELESALEQLKLILKKHLSDFV